VLIIFVNLSKVKVTAGIDLKTWEPQKTIKGFPFNFGHRRIHSLTDTFDNSVPPAPKVFGGRDVNKCS